MKAREYGDVRRYTKGEFDTEAPCTGCGQFEPFITKHIRWYLLPVRLHSYFADGWFCEYCIERERIARKEGQRTEASSKRRARRLHAMPAWADRKAIKEIYARAARLTKQTGIPHHVDHQVPLISPIVCGLHVPDNLDIIPARENMQKHNRFQDNDGRTGIYKVDYIKPDEAAIYQKPDAKPRLIKKAF